jgi:hypothetical protein
MAGRWLTKAHINPQLDRKDLNNLPGQLVLAQSTRLRVGLVLLNTSGCKAGRVEQTNEMRERCYDLSSLSPML